MPTKIYNAGQLKEALRIPTQKAIAKLGKVIQESTRQYVQSIVYDPYTPARYDRQPDGFNFKDSWIHQETPEIFRTTIFSDYERMTPHNEKNNQDFIHGSNYWRTGIKDIRYLLDDILINGKTGSLFGGGWWYREKRDFWTPLNDEYMKGDEFKTALKDAFAKNKLILI